ncbi:hypothetical protein D1AOALGA4SA_1887 [Olavius algarvensis Delta 1 endosymbiont]|nr:hypothetical protein D1AOALGA4SA_1887 [Olavius algarvensis Delta 1 endosymbiont]
MFITPEELMAGSSIDHEVTIPEEILHPSTSPASGKNDKIGSIKLRPLTVKDVQLIAKAAKRDEVLTSVLMIQEALVEPQLKQHEILKLHSGLVGFLVDHINRISGLSTTGDELKEMAEAPIVKAFFVLANEFNWTPQQVKEMTVGQILGYLELLNQSKHSS